MTNYYNPYQFQQQPTQTSGFISVRSEQEARNYPVAPGNSITFKDETSPYVYTKTMGFSQLDRPSFEKYKLVKEDTEEITRPAVNPDIETLRSDIDKLWGAIDEIKANVEKPATTRRKKDGDD